MYIDSDSPKGRRGSTLSERHNADAIAREAIADLLPRAISEHIVDDAPPDLDQVMSKVPRAPGWVCALVLVSSLAGLWTLIILAARALLH